MGFIDKVHWIHEQSHRIPNLLAEVVYIHECAHYIHFHVNSVDYINWAANERTLYVETFAQLVTDRMVKKSDVTEVLHCQIFDKLREHFTLFKLIPFNKKEITYVLQSDNEYIYETTEGNNKIGKDYLFGVRYILIALIISVILYMIFNKLNKYRRIQ